MRRLALVDSSLDNFTGELPSRLLRFFHEREHALAFLDGCVRLGELEGYRRMEGARGDPSEAEGRLIVPGENDRPVTYSTQMHQPTYILSCCHPSVDLQAMALRFGRFLVRLADADGLAVSLYRHLIQHAAAGRTLHFGDRGPIDYSKDQAVRFTPTRADRIRLNWIQKQPEPYSPEREYRIAFICEGVRSDAAKYICIPLSTPVEGKLEEVLL